MYNIPLVMKLTQAIYQEIHIPGLKPLFPLLLLSVVQLDRASQFAETLQDTALDSSYGFVRGDAFRKVIDGVRNGLYRTFEDVRMDLIRMVPVC
jgi:hypothetical protein